MKIYALACVLICCFHAAPESTKCQELKGLQHIGIVVGDLSKVDESMGLSREALKDQILVALKRDIPKLKIIEPSPGLSWVYLKINSVPAGPNSVSTVVGVSIERRAQIIGDDGTTSFSTVFVWIRETLQHDAIDRMPSHIRDEISGAMTAFAAEYYKQNP